VAQDCGVNDRGWPSRLTPCATGEGIRMSAAQTERLPILMYHQISAEIDRRFRKYTVSPRMFAAQMAWLALARYQPVTIDALLDARSGRRLARRAGDITVCDGVRGCG